MSAGPETPLDGTSGARVPGARAPVAGTASLTRLIDRLAALRDGTGRRRLVALAGPPASGKSTLAGALGAALPGSVVVPMDGFHLDDGLLRAAGLHARKGSPDTFDVAGLDCLLQRIVADEGTVHIPVFDRGRELSRAAAASVLPEHRLVIVEGNYLLLDEPPWRSLAAHFDLTVLLQVSEPELERRLLQRWREHGLDEAGARLKADVNDLPNGRRVLAGSLRPDLVIPG